MLLFGLQDAPHCTVSSVVGPKHSYVGSGKLQWGISYHTKYHHTCQSFIGLVHVEGWDAVRIHSVWRKERSTKDETTGEGGSLKAGSTARREGGIMRRLYGLE